MKYVNSSVVIISKSYSDIWRRVVSYIFNDVSVKPAATDVYHEDADRQFLRNAMKVSDYTVSNPKRLQTFKIQSYNKLQETEDSLWLLWVIIFPRIHYDEQVKTSQLVIRRHTGLHLDSQ
jgi:hypothetical protein